MDLLHLNPGRHMRGDKVPEGREGPLGRTTGLCSPRAGTCAHQTRETDCRPAGHSQDLPRWGYSPQVRHWLSSAHQALNARPEGIRNFTALWNKAQ